MAKLNIVSQWEGFLLTWLCPGLGHLRAGLKRRGRFYMGLLVPLFIVGQLLARGAAVNLAEHPFYFWLGQWWCGGFAIVGMILNWFVGGGGHLYESYEIGQLYVTSAILMNIIVWVDLFRRLDSPGRMEDK